MMDEQDRAELARVEARMERLITERTRNIPARFVRPNIQPYQTVQLIGGNTLPSGQAGILYRPSASLDAIYDPDVVTTLPEGFNTAWLTTDGVLQSTARVLVWHQFSDWPWPLLGGDERRVLRTTPLTAAAQAAPPGAPAVGARYLVGTGATGAFSGHDGELATWNGSSYTFSSAAGVSLVSTLYLLGWG